ncbi:MAG: HD domain-containing protein [Anaeroplasma sp.]|nr:HD domain-containing protein [Anaeroplasma sp.]
MFTKLERTKVFRDPLYGYITVDYKLISDLIDSKEVQRLRRIRQLSGVSMVFQTAEHSRFTHSLGVYQMANLVLINVEGMNEISEYEKLVFLCSALLHDIGHGPYSHAFEHVIEKNHEEMTVNIIKSEKSSVNKILSISDTLADDIASVISHDGKFPLIESLVSSQLDVDRMDYLSRDAYFTGAAYGHIDYFRILRSMKMVDNKLLVRASGVHSIESYLMSRYHMYFQVYYHPVARAYECLLEGIYNRIKDLVKENIEIDANISSFINVLNGCNDILEYINLDDAYVNGFIKQLTKSNDHVLKTLATAFENRHLFKFVELANDPDPNFLDNLAKKYDNPNGKYYYKNTVVSQVAYSHSKKTDIMDIKVLLPDGSIKSLDKYSPIIKSLSLSSYKMIERIYYFEED